MLPFRTVNNVTTFTDVECDFTRIQLPDYRGYASGVYAYRRIPYTVLRASLFSIRPEHRSVLMAALSQRDINGRTASERFEWITQTCASYGRSSEVAAHSPSNSSGLGILRNGIRVGAAFFAALAPA
jgi:hypothetical protein